MHLNSHHRCGGPLVDFSPTPNPHAPLAGAQTLWAGGTWALTAYCSQQSVCSAPYSFEQNLPSHHLKSHIWTAICTGDCASYTVCFIYLFIMIHACSFTVILNSTVCFELQHNTTQQLVYLQTNPVWCLVKHRTSVFTSQCNNLLFHSTRAFYVTVKTWCHRKCTSSWCGIMNTSKTDVTFTMTFTQTTILSTQRYH